MLEEGVGLDAPTCSLPPSPSTPGLQWPQGGVRIWRRSFQPSLNSPSGVSTVPSECLTAQNHLREQRWASLAWSLCSQHTAGQEEASWPRAGDILQDVRCGAAQF